MRAVGLPPTILDILKKASFVNDWFRVATNRFNLYSGSADPTTAEVPEGQWVIYKNTTSGEVRVWVNDSGALKKSAAFT